MKYQFPVFYILFFLLLPTVSFATEKAITYEGTIIEEFWNNTFGGLNEKETHLGYADLQMNINPALLGGWKNGDFRVHLINTHGNLKLSEEIIGDIQAASNIEAPRVTRLYEVWYEHHSEGWDLLFGLHDFNSDFHVIDSAGVFINSSFGIQPSMSLGGRPSLFPLTALGARLRTTLNSNWEWMFGIYDGHPGDPENSSVVPLTTLASDQGAFIASEVAYHITNEQKKLGSLKTGLWYNTAKFEDVFETDIDGNPLDYYGNYGMYLLGDLKIYEEKDEEGLSAFALLGTSADDRNEIDFFIGCGLNYQGLIPARDNDILGVAVAQAVLSDKIQNQSDQDNSETAIELTYQAHINPNVQIQPDIQYILNPGADPILEDALLIGVRITLSI